MDHLLGIGLVHSCFVAVFLATKRGRTLSDTVLAVWMGAMALPMMAGVAAHAWPDIRIPILRADLIYPLTYGPFLWLYVRTLTGDIDRLQTSDYAHFLPFVVVSLVQIVTGWAPPPPNPDIPIFSPEVRLIGAINLAVLVGYCGYVFRRLRVHGADVMQHFSELPNRVTLVWLRWIAAAISAVFFLLFLASAMSWPTLLNVHLTAQIAVLLVLSFFGLRQTQVFQPPEAARALSQSPRHVPEPAITQRENPDPDGSAKPRYRRSGLTEERAEIISHRLTAYMRREKPYLDAELTIETLAKQMAVPRRHLTQVISERHDKNFYLFVNEYRIEAVKEAMQAPENADRTLLDIAHDSGFNSKSTFNTAFKRLTGMTPSQYRAQVF